MSFTVSIPTDPSAGNQVTPSRLFVAWQDQESREYVPVGRLSCVSTPDGDQYEFVYLAGAANRADFSGLGGFPNFEDVYRSTELFPFFANRLMSLGRADREDFLASLALPESAQPFEILARSEGRRATDTFEIFPEPTLTSDGRVSASFLVRGIRHIEGAHDAVDRLVAGDHLSVLPEPENEHDEHAVLLVKDQRIGYLPRYLTALVHRAPSSDLNSVEVTVQHVGDRSGPAHFRLLCSITTSWPAGEPVFSGPEFDPVA